MNADRTFELAAIRFDEILLQGIEGSIEAAFESLGLLKADVWESLTSEKDKYLFEMRILEVKLRILGNSQSAVIDIVNLLQEINELEQFDHERLRINVGIGLKYLKRQCAGND